MIKQWLDRLQLGDWADKKVLDALEGHVAEGAVHLDHRVSKPKLLILDEPFSGLDPGQRRCACATPCSTCAASGTTVVFSTHDMSAAERLCDRIFMIFKGNKVLDGSLDEIQSRYGQDTVRVRTAAGAAALAGLPEVDSVADIGNFQDVRLKGDAQAFLRALAQKTPVFHFEMKKPSLHDIFVRIAKPTAEEMKAAAQELPHEPHPRRRHLRVPGARQDQGVHHRHSDVAGAARRSRSAFRFSPPGTPTSRITRSP